MLNRASAPPAKGSRRPSAPGAGVPPSRRSRPPVWRNPMVLAALAAVVVVVAVIVAIGATRSSSSPSSSNTTPASQSTTSDNRTLLEAVSRLDPAVVAAVGNGGLPSGFTPLKDAPPLTGINGRPEILYVGADYCPYCAAQRWGMVVALSRFGSFQNLGLTRSSSSDIYPDTATFTFHGATYTSQYVDLVAVETSDREQKPLDRLSSEQQALMAKYDAPPYVPAQSAGGIPWLDVSNRYVMLSSGFTPAILAGLSWGDIAGRLSNANDVVAKGIIGDANNITAAICTVTGMQPAGVCTSATIAPLVDALR